MSLFSWGSKLFKELPISYARVSKVEPIGDHINKVELVVDGSSDIYPIGSYVLPRIRYGITRAYSVAESERGVFTILVSFSGVGVGSRYFRDIKKGDRVEYYGPLDDFPYHRNTGRPKVFFATGTGVSPFVRMVKEAINEGHQTALLLGSPRIDDLPYLEYFSNLESAYKNFTFVPALSSPHASWSGAKGFITDHLHRLGAPIENCDVYVCGVPGMVLGVKSILKRLGVPKSQIFIQKFR